jgi:formyltetrahydrofolate hydrolase
MKNSAILLVSCPDAKGEVATIADFVYRHNGNILHADEQSGLFLMRVEFDPKDFDIDLSDKGLIEFANHFSPIAGKFQMTWRLAQSSHRPRMIILVSKYDHCLVDLLYRHRSGELACDIPLIISNHPDNQPIATSTEFPIPLSQSRKTTNVGRKNKSSHSSSAIRQISWSSPATCRLSPTISSTNTRSASSTSIIHFCQPSLAPSPTIKPSSAASN